MGKNNTGAPNAERRFFAVMSLRLHGGVPEDELFEMVPYAD